MKGMNSEDKFWIWFWGIISTAVVIFVLSLMIYNNSITKTYIKNGYEQIHIPNVSGHIWQKVECDNFEKE